MQTDKQKSETAESSELGRSKYAATPVEHLAHLINIGWTPESPLIQKYVRKHGLQEELKACLMKIQ